MSNAHRLMCGTALGCVLMAAANAQPGDAAAIAQARRDYANAMKGHDAGVKNAMRAELAAQLAMSRQRTADERDRAASRHMVRRTPSK